MKQVWSLAAALAMSFSSAAGADGLLPLNGGPFAGLRLVVPNRPGGFRTGMFVAGYDQPNPPPKRQADAIDGLMKGLYDHNEKVFASFVKVGADYNGGELDWRGAEGKSPTEPLTISSLLPLATICVNTDYWKMSEGSVRVSWICAGNLAYVSFFDFKENIIVSVRTQALPALTLGDPK